MTDARGNVESATTADLCAADLDTIRHLMHAAFGDRFSAEDWEHSIGGTHFVTREPEGNVVSHASVVARRLECSGAPISTGYVEAVATHPEFRGRGLATAIMLGVAEFIEAHFELGALSTGRAAVFYERLGWIRWRGATWCREEERLVRTPDDDGGVLVLPTRRSPPLDLGGDISVEWRRGDVW